MKVWYFYKIEIGIFKILKRFFILAPSSIKIKHWETQFQKSSSKTVDMKSDLLKPDESNKIESRVSSIPNLEVQSILTPMHEIDFF